MDIEALAGLAAVVDEGAVEEEVTAYVQGTASVRVPWEIENRGQADWAMIRLAEIERQIAEYDDVVSRWQSASKRLRSAAGWFEERLSEWAISNRTKSTKSFPLAHGNIATRETKARIEISDEAAALEWAKAHAPHAVKTVESVRVSDLADDLRIAKIVVAFESTDKTTGEIERLQVGPCELVPAVVDALRNQLGDGYAVEAVTIDGVVDAHGFVVGGFAVKPARVSASVSAFLS